VAGWLRCGSGQAEELQRKPVGVAVAGAQLGGDVRYLMQVQDPDDGVADRGPGLVRAADPAGIFPEDDVADIMMHLNRPVAAQVSSRYASRSPGPARSAGSDVMPRTATAPSRFPSVSQLYRSTRNTCATCGKSLLTRRDGGRTLMVRTSIRPCPRSAVQASTATARQHIASAAANSFGWFSPIVSTQYAPLRRIRVACLRWVCIWSAVMTAPARSPSGILFSSWRNTGISFVFLVLTGSCAAVVPSSQTPDSSIGVLPSRRAPRSALPSSRR